MNELIGFLVVLFIFFFPLIRKLLIRKQQTKKIPTIENSEPIPEEEEVPESSPFPHPQPITNRLVKNDFELHSEIEKRHLRGRLKQKKLLAKKQPESLLKKVLQGKKPEQAMVILSELYNRHSEF